MKARLIKPALVADHLVVRTATEEAEIDHLRQVLNQGHYLKAGRPAGHVLWQGIYGTDTEADCPELVAVLCWGGAAKRLKERDNHIGCSISRPNWPTADLLHSLLCPGPFQAGARKLHACGASPKTTASPKASTAK